MYSDKTFSRLPCVVAYEKIVWVLGIPPRSKKIRRKESINLVKLQGKESIEEDVS